MDADRAARIAAVGYRWLDIRQESNRPMCPLCLGRHGHPHIEGQDRYGFLVGLTRCDVAEAWYLDPYLDEDQAFDFYASGWYRKLVSAYHGRDVLATIEDEQRRYGRWLFDGAILDQGCCVLDIGGSTGIVGSCLTDEWYGCLVGLDPALGEGKPSVCDIGIRATIESAPEFEPCFDLILLAQTLDHLAEPRKALSKICRWLAPNGRLWVDILDVDEQVKRLGDWTQVRKIDHPCGLTRASLTYLLCETGYEVVRWVETAEHVVNDHVGAVAKGKG